MIRMWTPLLIFPFFLAASFLPVSGTSYDPKLDTLTDSLLREVLSRMGGPVGDYDSRLPEEPFNAFPGKAFEARREPSIRDQEYLEHSSLFANQYANGAGDGLHEKPDGGMMNMVKTEGALPGYCIPPNPCPVGYTADDGCIEHFVNSAAFSREYQASQKCMCDSEHMFDCPGSSRENEIDALARTFENEGLAEAALDRLIKTMEPLNPFLEGEKLPVVAKKAPSHPSNH